MLWSTRVERDYESNNGCAIWLLDCYHEFYQSMCVGFGKQVVCSQERCGNISPGRSHVYTSSRLGYRKRNLRAGVPSVFGMGFAAGTK